MPDYATHDAAEQAILDRSVLRAGGTTITPSAVDVVGLIVQGSAGQTGHLLQTKNSDGTDLVYIGARGPVIIQPQVDAGASSVAITQGNPAQRALLIKGAASQSASLAEFQNSAGSPLLRVIADGTLDTNVLNVGAYITATTGNISAAISARSASGRPLVIRGAASQTASLQEWQDSAGTVIAKVQHNGSIVAGTGNAIGTITVLNPVNQLGLAVRGAASQTANLQEWQDSAGSVRTRVSSNGVIFTLSDIQADAALYAGSYSFLNSMINAHTRATDVKGLVVKGAASQTANLAEFQNSSGTVNSFVHANGAFGVIDGHTSTTVGPGGGANALPANPVGYLNFYIGSVARKIPFYN